MMTAGLQLPSEWQLKQLVQRYLATIQPKCGETVQIGWFVFRVASVSSPAEIESLDFRKMASFTTDFSAAERVRRLQWEALSRCGLNEEACTLVQTAVVSRSYTSSREDAFLERQNSSDGRDSGWYVGVLDETKDMNDVSSFEVRSLYELSIADERTVPYWLFPVGKRVQLATGRVT